MKAGPLYRDDCDSSPPRALRARYARNDSKGGLRARVAPLTTLVACAAVAASSVAFEVRDTGAGIPAADLPNVFERFYRADPARARAGGGAGLGLAIVKQLVELQGGTISIASTVGRGTTVRFTLRLALATALR